MTLAPKVRAMVFGSAFSGALTLALAAVLARSSGLGPLYEVVPLAVLLGLSWAYPVLVLRTEETEAFQLDEAFFVATALLLPAAGTIWVFAAALVFGNVLRRRPVVRAAFNIGQTVTAAGLGLVAMHLIAPVQPAHPTPLALGAAVVGSAVFFLVNGAAVSVIISLNEEKRSWPVFLDGLDLRVLVWAGGTALGLLAALGGAAYPWALALGALPMAALNLVLHEHARARRQTQQAHGLLSVADRVHASVALGDVEHTVAGAARSLLHCRQARVDTSPPRPGEIGVAVPDPAAERWLIVSDPIGFAPLGERERHLLEIVAGIAAGALQNARLVEEIRHRAIHDPLTGLPNKVLFMDRLVHALAMAPRLERGLAVIFLDLDHFKVINDSLGHDTGDEVLLGVASRLVESLRPGDTAARLGGDEFAILCEEVGTAEDGMILAERIRRAASGTSVSNGLDLAVTASVGVVMADPACTSSAESLLSAADAAMFRAKERGRDRIEMFDDRLRDRAVARMATESTLRRAVDEGRLRVLYQPILDLATGRIVEAEALLRIETPSGALLSPADFIEVAEGSGLIARIGVGVLQQACRQAVDWQRRFGELAPARIAVNLSVRQLNRASIQETLLDILADTGCRPDMLALEITETAFMEAGEHAREDLAAVRRAGVTVGLDDFGTGYSSLAYLKRFPLDFLKIDRCFVAGLGHDTEDEAIIDTVVSLGRALNLKTVGEGVESVEQMRRLRALGCDRAQGYFFARPNAPQEIERLLVADGDRPWDAVSPLVA